MRRARDAVLFIAGTGTAAHLFFSWMGFNPTDEGFILAATRRILDGEIPHRDFITIRPAGPYLTFIPVMLLGGDACIWLSRWVAWLEFAAVGWCWVAAFDRMLALRLSGRQATYLAVTAFTLAAHTYPVMAWHSLDALAATAVGVALVATRGPVATPLGYAALGAACLSRQNFLPVAPLALLLTGDWRAPGRVAAALLPLAAAAAALAALGALPDALVQLGAKSGWFDVGVRRYLAEPAVWEAGAAGLAGVWLATGPHRAARFSALAPLAVLAWAVAALAGPTFAHGAPPFALFGAVLGCVAGLGVRLARATRPAPRVRAAAAAGILAAATAWCASISVGYNTPALMAGPLGAWLLVWPLAAASPGPRGRGVLAAAGAITAAAALVAFGIARCTYVYQDVAAPGLTAPLRGVLPGGRFLWTNPRTAAYMADLNAAVRLAGGAPYCLLPDTAVHWVRSAQRNPLPIDWPEGFTLERPELFARVAAAIERTPGLVLIVSKVFAERLPAGFLPLPDDMFHGIAPWARRRFPRIGGTRCFDLYRNTAK